MNSNVYYGIGRSRKIARPHRQSRQLRPLHHAGESVFFSVNPIQDSNRSIRCRAPLPAECWIRSSNGKRELRAVIRTELEFAGTRWPIDLTLTSRDEMGFRMLLGREALRKRFLVDAGRPFLIKEATPRKRRPKERR